MMMKRVLISLLCLSFVQPALAQDSRVRDSEQYFQEYSKKPAAKDYSAAVEKLLARMTLKEKVGQMTQLELSMISDGKGKELKINPAKLKKAISEYGVGSILNVYEETIPVPEWRMIIHQIQEEASRSRLKIPVLYGIDSIHGANYVTGATLFPQPIGMAATWNPELMLKGSQITAAEMRSAGVPWNFSPVLDVGRQPLWPRFYETFGEDVYLAKVMGVAAVRGYEGDDIASPYSVAACLKHYVGYSFPTNGHDRTPALIPEITMREYFLPTFAAAVKAGVHSVMVNSGEVNGIPGHVNHYLLTDVLKNELGFKGFVVSDWEDIKKLVSTHRIAATEKEATKAAVMAGIDMSMVPSDYSFSDLLLQLVQEGAVPKSRIDEAVRRILLVKYQLGLFDDPERGVKAGTSLAKADSAAVSLQAARESIVLEKNADNVLPLQKGKKLLVTGPTADTLISLNNGWTYTWQGAAPEHYPKDKATILQALKGKLGEASVSYVAGASYDKELELSAAEQAAKSADAIVVCLGEMSYAETPGNIDDLTLPDAQLRLAEKMIATGKPVVLVVVEGRPRIIRPIVDGAKAILISMNPGNEGGQALADVLVGDYNPDGRLPFTYPRSPNALLTYDHKAFEDQDTSFGLRAYASQFAFGSGLSYTTFEYSDLKMSSQELPIGKKLTVSFTVKNTGSRAGKEVVQLYGSQHAASVTPPGRRLKRFVKIALAPGETRKLQFVLDANDFAFIGREKKPVVEAGDIDVSVANLRTTFKLEDVQVAKR